MNGGESSLSHEDLTSRSARPLVSTSLHRHGKLEKAGGEPCSLSASDGTVIAKLKKRETKGIVHAKSLTMKDAHLMPQIMPQTLEPNPGFTQTKTHHARIPSADNFLLHSHSIPEVPEDRDLAVECCICCEPFDGDSSEKNPRNLQCGHAHCTSELVYPDPPPLQKDYSNHIASCTVAIQRTFHGFH